MRRQALLIGVSGGGIEVSLAARRLTHALKQLGFTIRRCLDQRATRAGILAELDRLAQLARPGDTFFVHYYGHGGRVRFSDIGEPFVGRVFGYITCHRPRRRADFEVILDHELSRRLSALDACCGDVTVMLDCCYSAELVRGSTEALSNYLERSTPDWAREALAEPEETLSIESHPGIVRICGASAKREAFAVVREGRSIGHMTQTFIDLLAEYGHELARITWAALIHRLRERVIERLQFEGQWVALAGPRERVLFSRNHAPVSGTISFVSGEQPGKGWIRAGWLQGVAVGDHWAVLDVPLDAENQPRVLARGRVCALERNRAQLELDTGAGRVPTGPACLVGVCEPLEVAVDDACGTQVIDDSAWLRVTTAGRGQAWVRRAGPGAGLLVERLDGAVPTVEVDDITAARTLLEQHARVDALRRGFVGRVPDPCPLSWTCTRIGDVEPLEEGAVVIAGQRIRVDVRHLDGSRPFSWFVSAVLIEADGQPRLLNARMPEGLELDPLDHESLGVRAGLERQGLALRWPAGLSVESAPMQLLFLASRRPMQLAHIVREQAIDEDEHLALRGLRSHLRAHVPQSALACAWARLNLTLRRGGGSP